MLFNTFLATITPLFLLYTDPGSGALLLQLLFAVLFGGLFYVRKIKDKVYKMLGKTSAQNEDSFLSSRKIQLIKKYYECFIS